MAKPRPKAQKLAEDGGKGKGKGKGTGKGTKTAETGKGKRILPSKKDAGYEHAGVRIAIHQKRLKHVEEVKEVSGRIMVLRFKGAGGIVVFISTYAPTEESTENYEVSLYDCLAKTVEEEQGNFIYIGGDLNARICERLAHEKEEKESTSWKEKIFTGSYSRKHEIIETDSWTL